MSRYCVKVHHFKLEVLEATTLDSKQVISFEDLFISQEVKQGAFTRLLVEKGIFTREEFLEMVKVVDGEVKRRKRGN